VKTAGEVSIDSFTPIADMLGRVEMSLMPNSVNVDYEDSGSYNIYKELPKNATIDEHIAIVDKLNQYYYENVGPIPLVRVGTSYVWNSDKILPFPHSDSSRPIYLEYIRHAQPLNTFRLFDVFPGR